MKNLMKMNNPMISQLLVVVALSFVVFSFISNLAAADVSVTISQSGADSGSVMAGRTFTVTASGWSGDCNSATIDLSGCGVCNISESQSKSISGSTVSWTTLIASKANSQSITVSVSGACTPDSGSESFDVKNPPSLSATVTPTSANVTQGSSFSVNLNIQNNGETTARFGTITVSPSDFSIASGCSPSEISGGQSSGVSCTISVSSSASIGVQTLTLSINPTNADSITKTVSVTVNTASTTTTTTTTQPNNNVGVSSNLTTTTSTTTSTSTTTTTTLPPVEETKLLENIEAGENATFEFEKSDDLKIQKIMIVVKHNLRAMSIRLKESSVPSGASAPVTTASGSVYKYLELVKEFFTNDNITSAKLDFKVEKSWINSNNIDKTTVSLYRYDDDSNTWEKLTTSMIKEDNNYVYYEAESTKLSIFAIAGQKSEALPVEEKGKGLQLPKFGELLPKFETQQVIILVAIVIVAVVVILIKLDIIEIARVKRIRTKRRWKDFHRRYR